ncbi:hypothetical protein PAI11_09890 [Patulibacter medicamentivorans]|jgi:Flp pilus assembly protein TadB|uniref:Uncharacterized protein n=1 Tax=Patulibacter medicamentivorans TaxID=1097667 RepID=H0E2H6_9ACTN|nr:hypothetical protein [Patulibacter medicamentivorans]EHN12130.1 hypothetical protein PAI11_09890 [Patulibacter medicamentivorans]
MSDLQRRSRSGLSRTQRVDKAFRLTVATGGLAVAAIVGLVVGLGWLVAIGVVGAVLSGWMLRNTLR